MTPSITLNPPRPATEEERSAITQWAIEQEKRRVILGEPDAYEENIRQWQTFYAEALMQVYPIRDSAARLCFIASRRVPFYEHGNVFGWEYAVWLCSSEGQWKQLDYSDSQLPLMDVGDRNG